MNDYSKYKSFICYRRHSAILEYGSASTALADFIKSQEEGECGQNLGEMFYEETATCNYKNVIVPIMKTVDAFIICICPGFFDRTINKYRELGGDMEAFRIYAEKEDVPYLEISEALKYDMNFLPVYVDCTRGRERVSAYDYVGKNLSILEEIFGDSFDSLIHKTNIPVAEYSFDDGALLFTKDLEKRVTTYFTDNYMSPSERENILKPVISRLRMYYDNLVTDDPDSNIDEFLPIEKNEPDISAYRRILSKYDGVYHISSAYINGVRCMKDANSSKNNHEKFTGAGFEDVNNYCHIEANDYVYWPVEFFGEGTSKDGVSICALCFGALMLRHYLRSDEEMMLKVLGSRSTLDPFDLGGDQDAETLKKKVSGALTLLMTFRDYEDFSWMSEWRFSEKLKKGTVNQTTLSISTILSLGFLEPDTVPKGCNRSETILNRFLYIMGSVEWLRSQCVTRFKREKGYFWAGNIEGSPTGSIALTTFSFDVYMKLLRDVQNLLTNEAELVAPYAEKLREEKKRLMDDIKCILAYLSWYAKESTVKLTSVDKRAICDCARAMRSLTDFASAGDMFDAPRLSEGCRRTAAAIFRRIYALSDDDILGCLCTEDMNIITEGAVSDQTERYEHCGHLITIDSLIKASAALNKDELGVSASQLKRRVSDLMRKFTDRYALDGGVHYKSEWSSHFPIYALYYYRTAVYDLYKYFYERFY